MSTLDDLWAQAIAHHQAGRVVDAADCYRRILSIEKRHHAAMNYLGAALAENGELEAARPYLERSVQMHPRSDNYWLNYGCLLEMLDDPGEAAKCFEKARALNPDNLKSTVRLARLENQRKNHLRVIALLEPALSRHPDDLDVQDALVIAYHHLGREQERNRLARHGMLGRDRIAKSKVPSVRLKERVMPPPPSAETRHRNIIAISLWGDSPRYVGGTFDNVRRAARHYPNWQIRVYCDVGAPGDAIEALSRLGAEVVRREASKSQSAGLFWRFEPLESETLDRVLVRDADCRIGAREAAAVDEWIAAGRYFHVMRDHPCNNELMLAGLWGGVCGVLGGLAAAAARYQLPTLNRWTDQTFLRMEVWPLIERHAIIHDSQCDLFGACPFPPHVPADDDPPFVGATYLVP